ncbi:site-specific integrase [Actinobaculum sp. 352]|uniref:site-specific integrase n=1 Tax=Actinobaculum sp. 352 TaxID=2490946 RepID=UPI000F7D8C77|nr:site-specific integrase [Actinobaculum sp. 352]RTE48795.1 hypothetical protein EKN07_08800 [Actinobaculum sp. 352]
MATKRRDAGSGSIYQRADGKWCAALTLPSDPLTGKQRRKVRTAKTKGAAQRKLAEMRRELDAAGDLATQTPTVAAYLTDWLTLRRTTLKPATWEGYRSKIEHHVLPIIGRRHLDKLTPLDIERVTAGIIDSGGAAASALQTHRILGRALADAERKGLIRRNPARAADAPRAKTGRRDAMPAEHLVQLITANADQPYLARVILALLTSARQGEILGLELDRLDLTPGAAWVSLTRELAVIRYAHGCAGTCGRKRAADCPTRRFHIPDYLEAEQVHGSLWLLPPKSVRSTRPIALGALAVQVMTRYFDVLETPHRFVFEASPGVPVHPRRDYGMWCEMLDRAGLPHYPLYALRHSTATLMRAAGIADRTRQEIMGHSSEDMTAHYTHREVEDQLDAVAAYDQYMTALLPGLQQ